MQLQTLNGNWLLRQRGTEDWLQATVPGGVYTDLLADSRIADPFYATGEEKVQWVAEKDWEYRRYFYPTAQVMAEEKVFLVCKGLDTLADVRLNGKIIGLAANMFHTWQWEIKSLLKEGENCLDILFHSPVAYARQRQRIHPMTSDRATRSVKGGQHLRKAASHFGWDWGPRLPGMGIWRDIQLEGRSIAHLVDVRYEQQHEDGMVMLTARVQCELEPPTDETGRQALRTLRLRVTAPDHQVWQVDAPAREHQSIPLKITNPNLWWPNGLGDQPLYRMEMELLEEDRTLQQTRVLDTWSGNLGLRIIELRQENLFQFSVNGTPVFAKGANWIPADAFPARVTPEQLEHLVRSAAETHQNMLRVWGGGYYENDLFYDLCDRYGILVWQDFQFACASYPLDEEAYRESVCREAVENIRRLRHHACLALWCGNNEIEWLAQMWGWAKKYPALKEAHERFFYQQLPELVAKEDPGRAYWPGSPSSGKPFNDPNSSQHGDAHLWEVYSYFSPPSRYRRQNPRFASEFGMQSLPAEESVAGFAPLKERRMGSNVMNHRQRSVGGNAKLTWYLSQRFRLPRHFSDLVYLSQVFQAEVIRTGVEHWRRHAEDTGGALYWQLNDCWPAISWSSIDYFGRWKALQYAARRFFSPVLLSVEEETDKQRPRAAVWLNNDLREPFQGYLRWTLETLEGDVLEGGHQAVEAEPVSACCLLRLDFSHPKQRVDWRKTVLVGELFKGEERVSRIVVAFLSEKAMPLGNPGLEVQVEVVEEQVLVHLSARRLARFIELKLEGANEVFNDNYFDLPAGRPATVSCPLPQGWDVERAQKALRVRSLGQIAPAGPAFLGALKGSLALLNAVVTVAASLLPGR